MKNQLVLYSAEELKLICAKLCDRIDDLFEALGIEDVRKTSKMFICPCPIHGGDNVSAFNIYPFGEEFRGNWKCRTHNCERVFRSSIIGFIRGVLSNRKYDWSQPGDTTVSFQDTLDFIDSFLEDGLSGVQGQKLPPAKKFENKTVLPPEPPKVKISRKRVRQSLKFPSYYYIDRGFTKDVLDRYDVGLCLTKGKEMYARIVVPIYNENQEYVVGCSGRSPHEKCQNCGCFHNQGKPCPSPEKQWMYSKWRHSKGFDAQKYLYNIWYARENIKKTKTATVVESPGNVWKLEMAGINNAVAIFGTSMFSLYQQKLLDDLGIEKLVLLLDNDEAGKKASARIIKDLSDKYQIYKPEIQADDVGEMSVKDIHSQIKTYMENLKCL